MAKPNQVEGEGIECNNKRMENYVGQLLDRRRRRCRRPSDSPPSRERRGQWLDPGRTEWCRRRRMLRRTRLCCGPPNKQTKRFISLFHRREEMKKWPRWDVCDISTLSVPSKYMAQLPPQLSVVLHRRKSHREKPPGRRAYICTHLCRRGCRTECWRRCTRRNGTWGSLLRRNLCCRGRNSWLSSSPGTCRFTCTDENDETDIFQQQQS